MVRVHATRLMRESEVSLWLRGRIVWAGPLGQKPPIEDFDTVALNVADGAQMTRRSDSNALTRERTMLLLSEWWQSTGT